MKFQVKYSNKKILGTSIKDGRATKNFQFRPHR